MEDASKLKTLADRILYLRNKKRMSQGDLADAVRLVNPALKCRQSTIHSIESGQVKRPTILHELARALNTTEEFLINGTNPPGSYPTRPGMRAFVPAVAQSTKHIYQHLAEENVKPRNLDVRLEDSAIRQEKVEAIDKLNEAKLIDKYLAAVHGSYLQLGLSEDQANELLEIVCEVVEEPPISDAAIDNYQSLKMLSASLTRRFLRQRQV